MVNWHEEQYVKQAQTLAQRHVQTSKPINELAVKVATDHAMSPDEIRTLVRLANVAVFQELFKRKDDGDKMVEFETGDPEAVIQRLVAAQNAPLETATVDNDKLAFEVPDQMRAKRYAGVTLPDEPWNRAAVEKTAAARPDLSVMALRKVEDEFTVRKHAAAQAWEATLTKLAHLLRAAPGYGMTYEDFEKDAYAEFGTDAEPELTYLRELTHRPAGSLAAEKVAALQEYHAVDETPALDMFKAAHAERSEYVRLEKGMAWVAEQLGV
jgi:hypothetical protein